MKKTISLVCITIVFLASCKGTVNEAPAPGKKITADTSCILSTANLNDTMAILSTTAAPTSTVK